MMEFLPAPSAASLDLSGATLVVVRMGDPVLRLTSWLMARSRAC